MIDINKKYTTRDGREVRLFTAESGDPMYPVVGAVKIGEIWGNATWTKSGISRSQITLVSKHKEKPLKNKILYIEPTTMIGL